MAGAAAGSHDDPADPSTIVGSRESVRLAFVAALQHLSPRQRAVLVLRDVLQWKAAEVGEAIGASTAAVNSLLQRARAQLDAVGPSEDDELAEPDSPETKDLLDRYIAAFEAYDIDELVKLFTDEAIWEMPPFDGWYQGPEADRHAHPGRSAPPKARATCASSARPPTASRRRRCTCSTGRPASTRRSSCTCSTSSADGVSHVVAFLDTSLFEKFGLPASL